jgi:phosphotransferase system enzyme I (PtsI)
MNEFRGISASPGIAMGKVLVLQDDQASIPRYTITSKQIEREQLRFEDAVTRASKEIEELKTKGITALSSDELTLLDTQLLMLSDPELSNKVKKHLETNLQNAEAAISDIMHTMITKLQAVQDEYLRERASDLHDVNKRILGQLMRKERVDLSKLSSDVILVCHDLLPSDAIGMDKLRVKGIAMDAGGKTSHTAILARAFEIPAVLGIGTITKEARNDDFMIIDGVTGKVLLNPSQTLIKEYTQTYKRLQKRDIQLMKLNELPAETKDGKLIRLKANIEIPEEVDAALGHGADGIGLYRSEFLFIRPGNLPDEDEQYHAYSSVLEAMGNRPVTIRTLDLGGDKLKSNAHEFATGEKNPILGWRAIRFCLGHRDIFRIQLRALFRASVHGNLRIMIPLISGLAELETTLEIVRDVKDELLKEGVVFAPHIPVGIMIEVPSAALVSDILAKKSHFFSIGTNDLIQYTIAVDRGNENIAYLYDPLHPGVLRLIRMVVENAHKAGIVAGMCGEMAGDPLYTLVLLGLGLDEFSMSSFGIPRVKQIIRNTSVAEAEEFVGRLMELNTPSEIEAYVRTIMEDQFGITDYSR